MPDPTTIGLGSEPSLSAFDPFFFATMVDDMSPVPNYFENKNQTTSRMICTVARKSGHKFFFLPKNQFSTYFDLKHHRNRDKLIYGLKKPKKTIPKTKINPNSDLFFHEL